MKTISYILLFFLTVSSVAFADGYEVGDKATDFKLKNTDGSWVSLSDFKDAKGFVVVFTCNGCPYAQAYQERIMNIDKIYKPKGYPVIAINSNDVDIKPDDSLREMKKRSEEMGYTFPYLKDDKDNIFKKYGATKTPHVFVLQKSGKDLVVKYIGAIDNNYEDSSKVTEPYLADALDALIAGKDPKPNFTRAIGCTIKTKE
ncbi:MAG: redoxin [Bacteroides sp. SM23_62_1]|nr:MAG: redoxin [Bacteroides sp. SM23_62_1]